VCHALPRSDRRARLAIIGIGNELRGDDAAGLEVVRRLGDLDPAAVAVHEHRGEGLGLIDAWEGTDTVLLVDAVRSGAAPGSIHVHDASARPLPPFRRGGSTHAFSAADAIELARRLGRLPATVIVFGVEGGRWELGEPLSDPVSGALPELVRAVRERALAHAGAA
jgi:hydrogenase maturation protease